MKGRNIMPELICNELSRGTTATQETGKHTILVYSPDIELCMSVHMMFEPQYRVLTTTDIGMLGEMASSHQPDMLVVDAPPSYVILRQLEAIKRAQPSMAIIALTPARSSDWVLFNVYFPTIDTICSKQFTETELRHVVDRLFENAREKRKSENTEIRSARSIS
ncbi:MAG: hypothetical protein HYR67_18415 [Bacteroidetes bacterium]|nr:hypothetical protein [Bacteroidota bacterium]